MLMIDPGRPGPCLALGFWNRGEAYAKTPRQETAICRTHSGAIVGVQPRRPHHNAYRRLKNFLSMSAAASRESALFVEGRGGSLPGAFLSGRLKLATSVALSEALAADSVPSGATVSSRR